MAIYDIAIVGSGIVGLATARQLLISDPKLKVLVIEKEAGPAVHQSGHNSGVIHSGVYYKPGSLKAQLCVRGYDLLRDFLRENEIAHEFPGKLIVAVDESEVPRLESIYEAGLAKGLTGLQILDKESLLEKEPLVSGITALFVPQTGIVDFQQVCQKLRDHFQNLGGEIFFNEELIDVHESTGQVQLITSKGHSYRARKWINCCGLQSDRIAEMLGKDLKVRIIPFRGEYYEIDQEWTKKINHLLYPVPNPHYPFLGVHITKTVEGKLEAGPNAVLALSREGYSWRDFNGYDFMSTLTWPGFKSFSQKHWRMGFKEFKRSLFREEFLKSLQHLIPTLQAQDLKRGHSGVRAQAMDRKGRLVDDFLLLKTTSGIHVLNAPSPAATSSLAIAEYIIKGTA